MIHIKTEEEIEIQRESSLLVGKTLAEVAKHVAPGIKTIELDAIAEAFIKDHGAVPGFKGYGGFPGSLCISVNDQVVHGIPGNQVLKEGDIVSIWVLTHRAILRHSCFPKRSLGSNRIQGGFYSQTI